MQFLTTTSEGYISLFFTLALMRQSRRAAAPEP